MNISLSLSSSFEASSFGMRVGPCSHSRNAEITLGLGDSSIAIWRCSMRASSTKHHPLSADMIASPTGRGNTNSTSSTSPPKPPRALYASAPSPGGSGKSSRSIRPTIAWTDAPLGQHCRRLPAPKLRCHLRARSTRPGGLGYCVPLKLLNLRKTKVSWSGSCAMKSASDG